MTEEFLMFLWKHRLYSPESLFLSDGIPIEVIHPGEHNRDAGPDFFNTRIKIGNTIWAGNAEVHVRSSDWLKHGHNANESFQNVILHIVSENDARVTDAAGKPVPVITLKCSESVMAQYEYLLKNRLWVPCARELQNIDSFLVSLWIEKIGVSRLEEKSALIAAHLDQTSNNWEEVLYRSVMRSFGFHLNGLPFENLAKSLPYKILEKHADSLLQAEALLFGQAGFLSELLPYDDYFLKLQKEYRHLSKKYNLKPVQRHLWKFLRLRPGNFPTIRLAQIAAVIHHHPKLFALIREASSVSDLKEPFEVSASSYWNNHYLFGKISNAKEKTIGNDSVDIILINAIIPILFMYGKKTGLEIFQNRALDFLGQLEPEKNTITENWQLLGIHANSAFHSQALLHLKNVWCDRHLCLECGIGSQILTSKC
jgi:hypothetical protein